MLELIGCLASIYIMCGVSAFCVRIVVGGVGDGSNTQYILKCCMRYNERMKLLDLVHTEKVAEFDIMGLAAVDQFTFSDTRFDKGCI